MIEAHELTEEQKLQTAIVALNAINKYVFANTIYCGSNEYFDIRNICVNTIKVLGGKVE